MVSYTAMELVVDENMYSLRSKIHSSSSLKEIRDMLDSGRKVLSIHFPSEIRLVQRVARALSFDGIICVPTIQKAFARANSLFDEQPRIESRIRMKKSNEDIGTRLGLTFCHNELDEGDKRYYSTKQSYECPPREYVLSLPPVGFEPVCLQLLARHGSRALNGHQYDQLIMEVWQQAKQSNMLTLLGEQLEKDVEVFMDVNNRVGRGELTQLGKEEHSGIGTRLFHRFQPLFANGCTISVMTSGKKRAVDSAREFVDGLTKFASNLQIENENPDSMLLYFHKTCSDYVAFKKTDSQIKRKMDLIRNMEPTKMFARQVLERIYKKEFVDLLTNGNYQMERRKNLDLMKEGKMREIIQNEVDVIINLYSMFSVSAAHSQPHAASLLAKYFNREESNWFAYVNDAREFYEKGPSIEGTTVTYGMAKPLLADFFTSTEACAAARSRVAARLRFAHAETVIPFATLLGITGLSDKAADPSDLYTYENNEWRGDKVAPMAANIQWEIYRHHQNHKQILVRMLYNEREVRFKQNCKSLTPQSFFYDFDELKRSYANILSPTDSID